jgi:cysteine desulfurase
MKVYLDNAATTPLLPEVFEAMRPFYMEHFGNPSSIHNFGRIAKANIENARKKISTLLNAAPSEIFFTSGGTEADNLAITGCVRAHKNRHIISSPLEHHAVLHTLEHFNASGNALVHFLKVTEKGHVDLEDLKNLLEKFPGALVSLMHANNETGNITPIEEVADICNYYKAYFHSDTVQTIGHCRIDLQKTRLFSLVGSAHKFHGPKGVGFIYINSDYPIDPIILGGAQERNMRGGTENVAGIMGMAKALEVVHENLDQDKKHILGLKTALVKKLKDQLPGVEINGDIDEKKSLYSILNISLPGTGDNDMLIFNLDINQIAVSAGSACSSGSSIGSHVLEAMGVGKDRDAIRFSFSRLNTMEEINYVAERLSGIYGEG